MTVLIAILLLAAARPATADHHAKIHADRHDQYNILKGAPAVHGYDPVAYHADGGDKPAKGDARFAHVFQEITYHFANKVNMRRFIETPHKYIPAYGGWCAATMATGKKVDIDPTAYEIYGGRLFLFSKPSLVKPWSSKRKQQSRSADAHWLKISGEEPPVADFKVNAVGGEPEQAFQLADARGQYVALHFLLKTDCPLCARFTMEYANRAVEVQGVQHVFLKPDIETQTAQWMNRLGDADRHKMPIYCDPDAALAKELAIPFGYQFHGETVHYPAFVLIDPSGVEVFRYVGNNNRERFTFDEFKKKMSALRGEMKNDKPVDKDSVQSLPSRLGR